MTNFIEIQPSAVPNWCLFLYILPSQTGVSCRHHYAHQGSVMVKVSAVLWLPCACMQNYLRALQCRPT